MKESHKNNLLKTIEKLRYELNNLGKTKKLTERQLVQKSQQLDTLLNMYYSS